MTSDGVEVPQGSVSELTGFWGALARRLAALRAEAGLSVEEVMRATNMVRNELELCESGERRLALPRLSTLARLYGVSVVGLLTDAAADVRPTLGGQFDPLAEALMLHGGITPEQMAGGVLGLAGPDAGYDGPVVGSRVGNPNRLSKGVELRRAYEAGASIRALAALHDLKFTTTRNLLVEAGTTLRPAKPVRRATGG